MEAREPLIVSKSLQPAHLATIRLRGLAKDDFVLAPAIGAKRSIRLVRYEARASVKARALRLACLAWPEGVLVLQIPAI